ncbi:MAG: paraquat-inducible protein A [Pseudomonadota bacterium]
MTLLQHKSAMQAGYMVCSDCHKLNKRETHLQESICERCGATIRFRDFYALQRTWAYLITSAIAFIPANVYPIMTVKYFGAGAPDTILSGIASLVKLGMMPIAIVVFIASFLVPLGKILGLCILLVSVHRKSKVKLRQRTLLYRIVELLGKWSMLDVFVVGIMAAVVQLGFVSEIVAGPGATAFATMVIFSMFAAKSFDPRLIWDLDCDDK